MNLYRNAMSLRLEYNHFSLVLCINSLPLKGFQIIGEETQLLNDFMELFGSGIKAAEWGNQELPTIH
ncbi:hypothetical protein SFC52_19805 [Niallia circulans]|uniref:hypothetical protein n=1 Tax=Niallia circulans TaxID=1397 RepID=UPI00398279E1